MQAQDCQELIPVPEITISRCPAAAVHNLLQSMVLESFSIQQQLFS
jgi:hypothetical protein